MKAAVVCANEDVRYMDYEEPVPGPGEVKVRVMASGICGSDIPRVLNHGVHFYPIVLGHEFSGYVTEVGEGVTKVKAGDHVTCAPPKPCMKCDDCQNGNFSLCKHYSFIGSREQGSNADYVVIPEQNAIVFDPSIPYEEAAMFVEGFCLSIAKYIASLSADVSGKVDVIILTGGIAWNASLMEKISGRISFIAPVKVYPGGNEMDSLAENGYAVLSGKMPVKYYQGIQ